MLYQYKLEKTRDIYPVIIANNDDEAIKQAQQVAKQHDDKLVEVWREEQGKFVVVAVFL